MGEGEIGVSTILTVLGLIGTGVAFMFSKQTVEAIITLGNWWNDARSKRIDQQEKIRQQIAMEIAAKEERELQERALDEAMNDKGYKYTIKRLDRRITELEAYNRGLRQEAEQCRQEQMELKLEHKDLQDRAGDLEVKCSSLETKQQTLLDRIQELERERRSL